MSVAVAAARVAELEQLLGGARATAPQPAAATSFAAELSAATAAAPVAGPAAATPAAGASALPAGTPYAAEITAAANRHGVDPALLAGLVKQESGFNANAVSSAGAR